MLGPRWEFLAWNAAQARLYPRINELEGLERNLLWVLFADPFTKELIVDWDIHSRQALAEFRAGTATCAATGVGRTGRAALRDADEFAAWWPEHDVSQFETRLRRFRHPLPACSRSSTRSSPRSSGPGCESPASCRSPAMTAPSAWPSATTWCDRPGGQGPFRVVDRTTLSPVCDGRSPTPRTAN